MIKYHKYRFNREEFTLDVSGLTIDTNQKVAILGENGCGKSTFINISCGLVGSANVEFNGKRLKDMNNIQRARTFSLFAQNPDVAFPFSVFEIVRMGRFAINDGKVSQEDNDRTFEVMTLFDIIKYQKRRFTELSGGEKRRVMLARAFNQDTPFMFLDEPVSMLDIRHSLEIMNIIEDSAKTIVASMHDINLAIRHFDRLLLMQNGRIIYDTPAKQVTPNMIEEVYNVKVSDSIDRFGFVI